MKRGYRLSNKAAQTHGLQWRGWCWKYFTTAHEKHDL